MRGLGEEKHTVMEELLREQCLQACFASGDKNWIRIIMETCFLRSAGFYILAVYFHLFFLCVCVFVSFH